MGEKRTIVAKYLSPLFKSQFGDGSVVVPSVNGFGIIGGYHIFQIDGKPIPSYSDFEKNYRDVLGITNDVKTGDIVSGKSVDNGVGSNSTEIN